MARSLRRARSLRAAHRLAAAALLLALSACAPAMIAPSTASPEDVARAEAEFGRDTTRVDAALQLAQVYRAADRNQDALLRLERLQERRPDDAEVVLLLGLTYEDLEQFARARELYQRYIEVGSSASLKRDLRGRLPLLRRQELELAVRAALQDEERLRNQPLRPRTVAVFPFQFLSQDSTYAPLSRALAELLSTDLSLTNRVSVLERLQSQLLLDELRLSQTSLADPATAARGGRLLGAERIVQGTLTGTGDQLRLDAAVVRVDQGENRTALSEADEVRQLFDMEKRLALRIYESMGIELTPAERETILQRPTENLQAILAYGRGLQAADVGNYAEAARQFAQAASLDPRFVAAGDAARTASQMNIAMNLTTDDLLSRMVVARTALELFAVELMVPDPSMRDVAAEALGTEGVSQPTVLELVIPRP